MVALALLSCSMGWAQRQADSLHFNDISAFTNFFKSRAGISPLSYRNRE